MSTPAAPVAGGAGTLTQAIYLASLGPARAALLTGAPSGTFAGVPYYMLVDPSYIKYGAASQAAAATLLAAAMAEGPVDLQCMMWGWSAPTIMQVRAINGYGWVPPYGSGININVGPGLPPPVGEVSNYPATMPAGWIKVSTDAADYPAYIAPTAPVSPVVWTPNMGEYVSWFNPATATTAYYYGIVAGQNPAIGQTCTYQGLAFVCQYYPQAGPIGGAPKMWLLTGVAS